MSSSTGDVDMKKRKEPNPEGFGSYAVEVLACWLSFLLYAVSSCAVSCYSCVNGSNDCFLNDCFLNNCRICSSFVCV